MTKPFLALLAAVALPALAAAQSAPPEPGTPATTSDVGTGTASGGASASGTAAVPGTLTSDQAESLQTQVNALQTQLEALKKQLSQVEPTWKGAPQFSSGTSGFTFKPKGYAQFDAAYVSTPGPEYNGTIGGLNYNNLGWNVRARRVVIGAEGALPGGFGYNVELNFAQGTVDYEDIVLTWQQKDSPLKVTVGNFYPLSSLESMTSSKYTSFMERASFVDAFNYNRRLGVAVGLNNKADTYTLTGGIFSQEINNSTTFNRTGWQASVRGTFSPTLGTTKLHLGANFQHRVTERDTQYEQYRSRPFTQATDQRFIDTGLIAAKGDDILGGEFGAIHGPLDFAGEFQKIWVRGYRPGATFGPNDGVAGAVFYGGSPSFETGYAEVGYFLTHDTRSYKAGRWDRVKVSHPITEGGIGAVQLNARFDYVNLNDRVNGNTLLAPDYVNGGKQFGYEVDLIWNPVDYLRFMAQYGRGHYVGGPRAATVDPISTQAINDRSYDVNTAAIRAQVEF